MRELREDTFSGKKDKDAHDHIDQVLSIVGLFNIPGVSKDAVMLRVFPFTLTRSTKRWVDRLAPGTINTWDLLKKAFIQRYCPPSMTAKQLEDIHNFKQEGDKSLYQAWEKYNGMLYKCPTYDINNHQKTIDDHSKKWHDRTTSRNVESSSSKDGLADLVNKLENLGQDIKKLKENVHAVQVGCQICEGPHLDMDCPLNEEVQQVKELRYREFGRKTPFNRNKGGRQILAETIKKYIEEASMRLIKQDEWLKTFCHNLEKSQNHHDEIIKDLKSMVTTLAKETMVKTNKNEDCKAIFSNGASLYTSFYYSREEIEYFLANSGFSDDDEFKNITSIPDEDLKQISPKQTTTHYIELYVPLIPFPRRLEQHDEEVLIHKTMETLKKIKSNQPFLKEIRQSDKYSKFIKDLEKDPGSFILPFSIGRTFDDEDDIEGIIDYLKPTSYDGFVDLDEEEYNKRRCRLLGMPYIEPLPIIIEQVKITRYSLGPGEVYTKLEVSNTKELPRTMNNVAIIRSDIMEEVFENYEDEMT
ncbi:hypothetical protein Tco_0646929 [Tanacetum coccineum]